MSTIVEGWRILSFGINKRDHVGIDSAICRLERRVDPLKYGGKGLSLSLRGRVGVLGSCKKVSSREGVGRPKESPITTGDEKRRKRSKRRRRYVVRSG